mmetsp:Transcript_3459/g.12039  ORF Transcript_3459/g.12039 Transcript_3459/m.12039 type:complete len:246 (+) Transcript_3459:434-1171(+)
MEQFSSRSGIGAAASSLHAYGPTRTVRALVLAPKLRPLSLSVAVVPGGSRRGSTDSTDGGSYEKAPGSRRVRPYDVTSTSSPAAVPGGTVHTAKEFMARSLCRQLVPPMLTCTLGSKNPVPRSNAGALPSVEAMAGTISVGIGGSIGRQARKCGVGLRPVPQESKSLFFICNSLGTKRSKSPSPSRSATNALPLLKRPDCTTAPVVTFVKPPWPSLRSSSLFCIKLLVTMRSTSPSPSRSAATAP